MPAKKSSAAPVIRLAPVGELRVYELSEHELEELAKGGMSSVWLNFALAFLPTSAGVVATMRSSQLTDLNFVVFTCVALIFALLGLICLVVWWTTHTGTRRLVQRIKARLPPPATVSPPNPEGTT